MITLRTKKPEFLTLDYAQEIAIAMLQRQRATAVIAARKLIVEGAIGMVEMALELLSAKNILEPDEERKAAMVNVQEKITSEEICGRVNLLQYPADKRKRPVLTGLIIKNIKI